MTIANVGNGAGSFSGSGASVTASFPGATTSGHLLVCWVTSPGSSSAAVTITGAGTWTQVGSNEPINNGAATLALFYKVADGTETTVTANQTGGSTGMQIWVEEYSGTATTSPLETSNHHNDGTTSGTTVVTGTITTAVSTDLIICAAGLSGTSGASPHFSSATLRSSTSSAKLLAGDYLPGTTLSGFQDTATWTTSRTKAGIIAAFKPLPKSVTLGVPSQPNTCVALTRRKSRTLGVPTQTNAALPLTVLKSRTLATPSVAHTTIAIATPSGTPVHLITTTHAALALTPRKSRTLGLPTGVDTTFALTARKDVGIQFALEAHEALHLTSETGRTIQPATQPNTALPIAAQKLWSNEYGLPDPSARQVPLTLSAWVWRRNAWDSGDVRISLKQSGSLLCSSAWTALTATPTQLSLPITGWTSGGGLSLYVEWRTIDTLTAEIADVALRNGTLVGPATQPNTATHLTASRGRSIGAATSTGSATHLTVSKGHPVGVATSTGSALGPITPTKRRTLNVAVCLHEAGELHRFSHVTIIDAPHLALPIVAEKRIPVGLAVSTHVTGSLVDSKGRELSAITTSGTAQPLAVARGQQLNAIPVVHVALPLGAEKFCPIGLPETMSEALPIERGHAIGCATSTSEALRLLLPNRFEVTRGQLIDAGSTSGVLVAT